jgi:mRNA interferase RelE/StbE
MPVSEKGLKTLELAASIPQKKSRKNSLAKPWSVEYSQKARKNLKKLPKQARKQIIDAVKKLGAGHPTSDIKKLKTYQDSWRLRVGEYRVIFKREKERTVILVIEIGRRGKNTY